jgi:5-methylcytosine-specific restriction endonuclease McrA
VHYASDCPFGGCGLDCEADHVDAYSTGGATTLENGVVSCRRCNRLKGARPVEEFVEDPDGDGVPGFG